MREACEAHGRVFPVLLRSLLEATHSVDRSKFSGDQPRTLRGASMETKLMQDDEQRDQENSRLMMQWTPGSPRHEAALPLDFIIIGATKFPY